MQTSDQRFKTALTEIRDRVVTGESFTDALKDYEDYFDVIFVAMVRVGEVTGTLGESLKTIAGFMEKRQRVESKVLTAMIYPLVLVFFCLGAIVILTTKVIPPIGKQIIQAGQELPWITQQLMNFSHVLTSWRVLVLLAVHCPGRHGLSSGSSGPSGAPTCGTSSCSRCPCSGRSSSSASWRGSPRRSRR